MLLLQDLHRNALEEAFGHTNTPWRIEILQKRQFAGRQLSPRSRCLSTLDLPGVHPSSCGLRRLQRDMSVECQ